MAKFQITVNGKGHEVEALADTPLLWVLRDNLSLAGTKYGCGLGGCGACTVLIDGKPTRSCQVRIEELGAKKVVTIEGISADGTHPVQKAWIEEDVPQCGFCQSGQILQAVALLETHPKPTDQQIDDMMNGNFCRCGTYSRIRKAIKRAAQEVGS